MDVQYHGLLQRQCKRYLKEVREVPAAFERFISAVNDAYHQYDNDLNRLERSMELSSQELIQAVARRKQIEEQIILQNKGLATLQNSTVRLMNTLDSQKITSTVLEEGIIMTGAQGGFILLPEEDKGKLCIKEEMDILPGYKDTYLAEDETLMWQSFVTGETLMTEEYKGGQRYLPNAMDGSLTTLMVVPLSVRKEVIALICLLYFKPFDRGQNEIIEMIQQFAVAAAIALDNARLYAIAQGELMERRRIEEELRFLSSHDTLTGLFNRNYFEAEIVKLKENNTALLGLIICDVDGLKIINDTLGHAIGDGILLAAARIMSGIFSNIGQLARIGGDEFAILLPGGDRENLADLCEKIKVRVNEYNELQNTVHLSISTGYASNEKNHMNVTELFKEADNHMYREKMQRAQSTRDSIVHTMMKRLEVREGAATSRARRIEKLAVQLAKASGYPEGALKDIRLLSQFYDVGKVGIPDYIIYKSGALTEREIIELRRHSEVGQRIALVSLELTPIADWVLKHHEWWNGQGYPLGLQGEYIPYEARIIGIVDAYSAMRSDRAYSKALNQQEALKELKRGAGTQFDPVLVEKFIMLMGELSEDEL